MEIGSIYEINPKCIENIVVGTECPDLPEVNKYGKSNTAFTASGRAAIGLALRSLETECPQIVKKCLMPAYMCDSVFVPFNQNGWQLCFYHVDKYMRADREELCRMLETEKPGMLFIHPYYGVDTWKEIRPILWEYQKSGLIIMEDVTQSYYLQVESKADYIVGSLRKWYAIPDGGFLATNKTIHAEYMAEDDFVSKTRLQMLIQKWNYLQERYCSKNLKKACLDRLQEEKENYLAVNRKMEAYLDEEEIVPKLSDVSTKLLCEVKESECRKRRNENYRILIGGLQNRKSLTPVFPICEEAEAPLYLPVYMKDRDSLQQYLRQWDIYVPVLWPVGTENENYIKEEEAYIFEHLAAIPIDQRYGKEQMQRIIEVIEMYEASL